MSNGKFYTHEFQPGDDVVLLIGETGSGKTEFIRLLKIVFRYNFMINKEIFQNIIDEYKGLIIEKNERGSGFQGGTDLAVVYSVTNSETKKRYVFIDIPGVNNTALEKDAVIDGQKIIYLKELIKFIKSKGGKIIGVLNIFNSRSPRISSSLKYSVRLMELLVPAIKFEDMVRPMYTNATSEYEITFNPKDLEKKYQPSYDIKKAFIIDNPMCNVHRIITMPYLLDDKTKAECVSLFTEVSESLKDIIKWYDGMRERHMHIDENINEYAGLCSLVIKVKYYFIEKLKYLQIGDQVPSYEQFANCITYHDRCVTEFIDAVSLVSDEYIDEFKSTAINDRLNKNIIEREAYSSTVSRLCCLYKTKERKNIIICVGDSISGVIREEYIKFVSLIVGMSEPHIKIYDFYDEKKYDIDTLKEFLATCGMDNILGTISFTGGSAENDILCRQIMLNYDIKSPHNINITYDTKKDELKKSIEVFAKSMKPLTHILFQLYEFDYIISLCGGLGRYINKVSIETIDSYNKFINITIRNSKLLSRQHYKTIFAKGLKCFTAQESLFLELSRQNHNQEKIIGILFNNVYREMNRTTDELKKSIKDMKDLECHEEVAKYLYGKPEHWWKPFIAIKTKNVNVLMISVILNLYSPTGVYKGLPE